MIMFRLVDGVNLMCFSEFSGGLLWLLAVFVE